jgi:hypothetical protein
MVIPTSSTSLAAVVQESIWSVILGTTGWNCGCSIGKRRKTPAITYE